MSRFHWGWRIAAVYTLFASATLAFVAFAFTVDVDLVRPDYYEHSLLHDDRMQARRAASSFTDAQISLLHDTLMIRVPAEHRAVSGTVEMYYPGSTHHDQRFALTTDATGTMIVPVPNVQPGKWEVTATWDYQGRTYEMSEQFQYQSHHQ